MTGGGGVKVDVVCIVTTDEEAGGILALDRRGEKVKSNTGRICRWDGDGLDDHIGRLRSARSREEEDPKIQEDSVTYPRRRSHLVRDVAEYREPGQTCVQRKPKTRGESSIKICSVIRKMGKPQAKRKVDEENRKCKDRMQH